MYASPKRANKDFKTKESKPKAQEAKLLNNFSRSMETFAKAWKEKKKTLEAKVQ